MIKKRVGKISVSQFIVDSGIVPKAFFKIEFTVTRCEHLFHSQEFEYYGISPQFEEIEQGQVTPTYDLTLEDELFKLERQKL